MTKTKPSFPETPELDKQKALLDAGTPQVVQAFYDWLDKQGYVLAKYQTETTEFCEGVRRDPFDPSNCDQGVVKKTVTQFVGRSVKGKVEAGQQCPKCNGTGEVTVTFSEPPLVPQWINPEQLMAEHFEIDLNKIETERRALLDYLRDQHDAETQDG